MLFLGYRQRAPRREVCITVRGCATEDTPALHETSTHALGPGLGQAVDVPCEAPRIRVELEVQVRQGRARLIRFPVMCTRNLSAKA